METFDGLYHVSSSKEGITKIMSLSGVEAISFLALLEKAGLISMPS